MVSSRTEKAFELSFFLEFLSAKEPNRPQKVVTSGYEVITSDPEKYKENSYIWHKGETGKHP